MAGKCHTDAAMATMAMPIIQQGVAHRVQRAALRAAAAEV